MNENIEAQSDNQIELTADIVAAYVSNNSVPLAGLADLIASVHRGLANLRVPAESAQMEAERPTPAQIRKSIMHDGLVSFVDGKTYKTLKRHLSGAGLDPASYRQRYGLPNDYPMTAPSYSEQRSALAKSLGLGQQRRKITDAAEKAAEAGPEKAKKGPGRPRRTANVDAAQRNDAAETK